MPNPTVSEGATCEDGGRRQRGCGRRRGWEKWEGDGGWRTDEQRRRQEGRSEGHEYLAAARSEARPEARNEVATIVCRFDTERVPQTRTEVETTARGQESNRGSAIRRELIVQLCIWGRKSSRVLPERCSRDPCASLCRCCFEFRVCRIASVRFRMSVCVRVWNFEMFDFVFCFVFQGRMYVTASLCGRCRYGCARADEASVAQKRGVRETT